MIILGLSFDYHDAAAAILCDGVVIAAAQEERFSRKKNDRAFPVNAIQFCLAQASLTAIDLDHVVFYEQPLRKFDRIRRGSLAAGSRGEAYLESTLRSWLAQNRFDVCDRIARELCIPLDRVSCIEHHQSHAASAFFCSPFEAATVITLDGVGEDETASVSIGKGTSLQKLYSASIPDSIGLLYSAFTAFLGFEVNEGEYKVMGMAGFGSPVHLEKICPLMQPTEDGLFRVSRDHFDFLCPEELPYTPLFLDLLGQARVPESPFEAPMDPGAPRGTVQGDSHYYADIAASVQELTENTILHVVSTATRYTGIRNVCLAGGVALNSMANGRIERDLGVRLYVQPAAGDAGGSLGAALFYHHCIYGGTRVRPLNHAYLGQAWSMEACEKALKKTQLHRVRHMPNEEALVTEVARLLAEGAVIGWFHGRFEWGPRALGARSILADPRRANMKSLVNEKIKFREPFRPFAPSVLAHRAGEFFALPPDRFPLSPEDFMLSVSPVHEAKRDQIPAVTHVDNTSRVQLVRSDTNPRYHALIESFDRITGIPMVLNTSFNRRGEPIVASPEDAIETFLWTELDYLVLEELIVSKEG